MGQKYLHLLVLNKPFKEAELQNAVQFNQLELAINIYEQNTKVTTQNTTDGSTMVNSYNV